MKHWFSVYQATEHYTPEVHDLIKQLHIWIQLFSSANGIAYH
jgi:hypothetical protein